ALPAARLPADLRLPAVRLAARLAPAAGTRSAAGAAGARLVRRGLEAGLREEHLDVTDAPLGEAALRPAQIKLPQPPEALVVAELGDAVARRQEALAPGGQRARVVARDVVEL